MDHALLCLRDALHVLTAAAAVSNPPLKETLTRAAAAAAESAALELRRSLQPAPPPLSPILPQEESALELLEPAEEPLLRPYQEFVAALVPVLRAAYPTLSQQQRIAQIGQLWQHHKNAPTLNAAIAAASEAVREVA